MGLDPGLVTLAGGEVLYGFETDVPYDVGEPPPSACAAPSETHPATNPFTPRSGLLGTTPKAGATLSSATATLALRPGCSWRHLFRRQILMTGTVATRCGCPPGSS